MKHLKTALVALAAALAFTACSDDDNPVLPPAPEAQADSCVYVINQGNYYGGVDGTIGTLNLNVWQYTEGSFLAVNGVSLGDSPQGAVRYGSKIYVPMYGSNCVWVLDAATLRAVAQVATNEPEGVAAAAGYVFVSNNDGYVSRIDTLTNTIDRHESVGPNPCNMAAYGNNVYVSISDGYNYESIGANGKRVCVIDAQQGTVTRSIACGLNPGPIACDGQGNVFVVSRGDYYTVPSLVQKINVATNEVTDIAEGQLIAVDGATLYVLNSASDYVTGACSTQSYTFSTVTGDTLSRAFLPADSQVGLPVSIDVDAQHGYVYICSDNNAATGYRENGSLHVFTTQGEWVKSLAVGMHPCGVVSRKSAR